MNGHSDFLQHTCLTSVACAATNIRLPLYLFIAYTSLWVVPGVFLSLPASWTNYCHFPYFLFVLFCLPHSPVCHSAFFFYLV